MALCNFFVYDYFCGTARDKEKPATVGTIAGHTLCEGSILFFVIVGFTLGAFLHCHIERNF